MRFRDQVTIHGASQPKMLRLPTNRPIMFKMAVTISIGLSVPRIQIMLSKIRQRNSRMFMTLTLSGFYIPLPPLLFSAYAFGIICQTKKTKAPP